MSCCSPLHLHSPAHRPLRLPCKRSCQHTNPVQTRNRSFSADGERQALSTRTHPTLAALEHGSALLPGSWLERALPQSTRSGALSTPANSEHNLRQRCNRLRFQPPLSSTTPRPPPSQRPACLPSTPSLRAT